MDYSENAQIKFRVWLQKKYRTIDKLNDTWGTSFWSETYQNFDQVRLPSQQEVPDKPNPHAMLDLNRFMADELAGFVNMQADILRQHISRDQWITTNLIPVFNPVDPVRIDHTDFLTYTRYLVTGHNQGIGSQGFRMGIPEDLGFSNDQFRNRVGKTFGVMELQPGQVNWGVYNPQPLPGAVRMRMPGTRLRFDRNEIQLDSAVLHLGRSDLRLTGNVTNLAKSFFKKEELKAQLLVTSDRIDCNQLMRAMERGTAYMEKVKAGFRDTISTEVDDMDEVPVVSDTTVLEGSNCLFVVPPGIDFTFQTDIKKVLFGKLQMDSIHGEVVMRNQCIQLSDLELRSSAANMSTTALYRATDTTKAYAGFALQMHDIRIDSLVGLIPSLDTLFPMLRSFEGLVDFHIAADSWLDSAMNIDLPTLRAAAYLDGRDLVLMDGETFAEISKMLMFKNKKRNMIDSISVDLMVKDGTIEIFPFLVEIDRYKAAVGGQHNIDMTFKYHISILKSPLPFRAGVDISGNLDKMKFRITKAKYKDLFIPSRKAKVDSTQLNLRQRMRTILKEGKG